jgi:hypothetical protein
LAGALASAGALQRRRAWRFERGVVCLEMENPANSFEEPGAPFRDDDTRKVFRETRQADFCIFHSYTERTVDGCGNLQIANGRYAGSFFSSEGRNRRISHPLD